MKGNLATPARGYYGPQIRPGGIERCVCGLYFTTYWVHRQTGHHKRAMIEQRAKLKAAGLFITGGR